MVDVEQPLLRFGPFGVAVNEGPFGIFRWHWRNVFRIELTDRCLRGVRVFGVLRFGWLRGGHPFEIPYAAIVSVKLLPHPSPISLMEVLDITYRDAQGVREKSITAYTPWVEKAFVILQQYAPGRYAASRR